MGNHDYEDINKTGIDYLNYFPFLSKLYGNTSGKSKYYDIKLGPCHFFILDIFKKRCFLINGILSKNNF